MLVRYAFFEGKVKPGCEEQFYAFVKNRLVPLWTKFPGAEEVRVMRQLESDTDNPHYALVLAIKYPNRSAIEEAMKSDMRTKSRAETMEMVKMFDGRIFHTVFELAHNETLAP